MDFTVSKVEKHRQDLRKLEDWRPFLLEHSGLPGPRGNIELARAVAEEGDVRLFEAYLEYEAERAPTGSPYEFLAFCGLLGLGRLLAEGHLAYLSILRTAASDPRWRIREAVAMALQRLGAADMPRLLMEMKAWGEGTPLEQRAAAAALCEPSLLNEPRYAREALALLDDITGSVLEASDRKSEAFKALRKGLAYCWSVAVAALPSEGKARMEAWFGVQDRDIRWVMRQNLKKKRLARVDPVWVEDWRDRLMA